MPDTATAALRPEAGSDPLPAPRPQPADGARGARRPDIAVLVHDLRGGGAERVTLHLANGFAAAGYAVDLVMIARRGVYLDAVDPRVRVVALGSGRTATALGPWIGYLRRSRPNAVLSAMTHVNILATAGVRLSRVQSRLALVEHNMISRNAPRKRGLVRLAYRAVPGIYRRADRVIAVSRGVADDLARWAGLDPAAVSVAFNPVVDGRLIARSREAVDDPWLAPGGPPVILGVGRLTRQKNFPLLLDAFAQVARTRPARLVILGEGEERAALEARVAALGLGDRVRLPGFADNPYAWMRAAAVFALSSDWEGLPTVLIEAMACGTRVVATDCESGPDEILEGGRWGGLVPTGDPAAFAAALDRALDAAEGGPDTAAATRAADFSFDAATRRYAGLLLG